MVSERCKTDIRLHQSRFPWSDFLAQVSLSPMSFDIFLISYRAYIKPEECISPFKQTGWNLRYLLRRIINGWGLRSGWNFHVYRYYFAVPDLLNFHFKILITFNILLFLSQNSTLQCTCLSNLDMSHRQWGIVLSFILTQKLLKNYWFLLSKRSLILSAIQQSVVPP